MLLLSLLIDWHPASLIATCAKANAAYAHHLDAIEAARGPRTFANTVLRLERARMEFYRDIGPARVAAACAPDSVTKDEAVFSRPKLYAAISHVPLPNNPLDAALEKRWIALFQRNGAALTPPKRKEFLAFRLSQSSVFNPDLNQRIAHILGYESWNDYIDADRSAGNAMRVDKFMQTADATLKPIADAQEQQLKEAFAASQGRRKRAMQQSDVPYAEELLEKRHGLDEVALRQWFPADETHAKVFSLVGTLFGVSIARTNEPGWDPSVSTFAVSDAQSGKRLGSVYVFTYPQGQSVQATTIVPGLSVVIAGKETQTLTHDDLVALFGATCEGLRQLLAATPYETLNENIPLDFVTAPAQMCESFAWDGTALRQVASDNPAGQSLPDELVDKIVASRSLYNAYQLRLASGSWEQLWGRLYADDLFTAFSSGATLDPAIGARFRSTILAPAGSLDPDTEVQNFLGRPISPNAFYKEFTP